MPIDLPCPNCGNVASVAEESLGRRARCRKCGEVFAMARPDGGPASGVSGDSSAWKGSSASSPTDLPEQFGRYRIMRKLGQGGMGAVYLAHDIKLDRRVALKVPFFHPSDGPQAIQRFEREARAAANLDHPNLCPVFDVGEVDGIHYLTMPYIEGKPLSEAMPRGRTLPESRAAAVARKLALALAEAHARGVVHRDLKPGNIMVNRRREMVIMDFGLARRAGGEDAPLTRTGHVLGTALYMAPEQAAGDLAATGPASDVYSLGVILYELLTGVRPFEGPWSLVIGLKNVQDPDPPSKHRPDLSPTLDAVCLKAIAREPGSRYSTMAEFAEALGALPTIPARAAPSASFRRAEGPERSAEQIFAGVVLQETASLRGGVPTPRQDPHLTGERAATPLGSGRIVALVSALAIAAGGIALIATRQAARPGAGGSEAGRAHRERPTVKESKKRPGNSDPVPGAVTANLAPRPGSGDVDPVRPGAPPQDEGIVKPAAGSPADPIPAPEGLSPAAQAGPQAVVAPEAAGPRELPKPPLTPAPDPEGVELINNPGAEDQGDGRSIPAWKKVVGDWTSSSGPIPAAEGASYFYSGKVAYGELVQDVDVGEYAARIARKRQSFRLGARVRSLRQRRIDCSQVVIEFLDKRKTHLSYFALPPVGSVDRWRPVTTDLMPPPQTHYIRVSLRSHRIQGDSNGALFDAISLKAIAPPVAPADGPPKPAPDRPAKSPAHSFVLSGNWRIEGEELVQTDRENFDAIFLGGIPPSDYNLKYRTKFLDGPTGPRMYLVFHYDPPLHHNIIGEQYWFEIKEKRGDQQQALMIYWPQGEWKPQGEYVSLSPLDYGKWYDVELQVRGGAYRVVFDGREVFRGLAKKGSGRVGLGSAACITRYKDISITNARNEPLWVGLPDDLPEQ